MFKKTKQSTEVRRIRLYSYAHILYSKITGDQDVNKNTCRFCASIYSTAKEPNAKQM